MKKTLTIGAPDSDLSRAHAQTVVSRLRSAVDYAIHLELFDLRSQAENDFHDDHIATNRAVIEALHDQLRDGEVDMVIHTGFDLRGQVHSDFRVAAILQRLSPYDALLSPLEQSLDELEDGTRLGVVQLRARAQLLEHRPDLDVELVAGDVGHWLTALIDGDIEALVAPNAALEQLGLHDRVSEIFPPEMVVPAPCSGVLVCVARADDDQTQQRVKALHHVPTAQEYAAEIAFMEALGGAWQHPVGTLAQSVRDEMAVMGLVASPDGSQILRRGIQAAATDPEAIGETLAELLLEQGAGDLLEGLDGGDAGSISGLFLASHLEVEVEADDADADVYDLGAFDVLDRDEDQETF